MTSTSKHKPASRSKTARKPRRCLSARLSSTPTSSSNVAESSEATSWRAKLRESYQQHLTRREINDKVSRAAASDDLTRWRELRATLPAGAHTQEMVKLRCRLLESSEWMEVYRA